MNIQFYRYIYLLPFPYKYTVLPVGNLRSPAPRQDMVSYFQGVPERDSTVHIRADPWPRFTMKDVAAVAPGRGWGVGGPGAVSGWFLYGGR